MNWGRRKGEKPLSLRESWGQALPFKTYKGDSGTGFEPVIGPEPQVPAFP